MLRPEAWDARGGGSAPFATLANVETTADVSDVCIARCGGGGAAGGGAARDSGLLLCAGEQKRLMAYFVPALGPAPSWCSFVDALTEELEEETRGAVFDDYKFVTEPELEELGAKASDSDDRARRRHRESVSSLARPPPPHHHHHRRRGRRRRVAPARRVRPASYILNPAPVRRSPSSRRRFTTRQRQN